MKIREHELDVDILGELENFSWVHSAIKGNKLQACSPFREEKSPSFAVNLDTSTWVDSGSVDEQYHKGNLVTLLAYLRNESYEEIEDYLIAKYALMLADSDALQLNLQLTIENVTPAVISRDSLAHLYTVETDYFTGRGISPEVQQQFGCGYDADFKAVAILWTNIKGQVINVKYRNVAEKVFFYQQGGQPIHNHLYGMYEVIKRKSKRVFVCESEIDALTLWTFGYPAIAVGGSSLSDQQKKILLNSEITELVIATDNDRVGNRFREYLIAEFMGNLRVLNAHVPTGKKDVNELTKSELETFVLEASECTPRFMDGI